MTRLHSAVHVRARELWTWRGDGIVDKCQVGAARQCRLLTTPIMQSVPDGLGIGGIAPQQQALALHASLRHGRSFSSTTFGNPELVLDTKFDVAELECWLVDPAALKAGAEGKEASVLEKHRRDLEFIGITGRATYSAGFREEVPENLKKQLRV